jgi:Mn2+/Fe2+ NRAMP family transporter
MLPPAGVLLTCVVTFIVLSIKYVGSRALEHIMAALVLMLAVVMFVLSSQSHVEWGGCY